MSRIPIRSFHSIHNVVDRGVLYRRCEFYVGGTCGPSWIQRDQLIICQPRLSENALLGYVVILESI